MSLKGQGTFVANLIHRIHYTIPWNVSNVRGRVIVSPTKVIVNVSTSDTPTKIFYRLFLVKIKKIGMSKVPTDTKSVIVKSYLEII